MNAYSDEYLEKVLRNLTRLPRETEWLEFKSNNKDPRAIGEYISALANSAALHGQAAAYMVWGVEDENHSFVGTTLDPESEKVGNENLRSWLLRLLEPQIDFSFNALSIEGSRVVVLVVGPARTIPVKFQGAEYIRITSYKKPLRDHPDHARRLWRVLDRTAFEDGVALEEVRGNEVLALIDYPSYFDLMSLPLPENRTGILSALEADRLIRRSPSGEWNISNLGGILFAKDLPSLPSLSRKALRIIQYRGNSRVETIREQEGVRGYACGFEGAIDFLRNLIPTNEVIGQAFREAMPLYPDLAVRELVANALIHQDFTEGGVGPLVELFEDRLEITSPGVPLIDPLRFVDAPPRSRNESVASMMRRIGICEERGSGWDKVAFETELHQLPAPLVETPADHTRVVLFGPRTLREMDKSNRIRAVYMHACLRYVTRRDTTNSSVRERFKIEQHNSAQASRLIAEAVEARMIVPYDRTAARSQMRYEPYWASGEHQAI